MDNTRRNLLKATAAFTTSLFTGKVKGANDRTAIGYIGIGKMGRANLAISMGQGFEPVVVCDVFQRNLEIGVKTSDGRAKPVRDFREVLANPSIDAVCIAAPDHWHAYMAVEACKAGKDVYVEKPVCYSVDEGVKMVQARKIWAGGAVRHHAAVATHSGRPWIW